eukprot:m.188622 g.188622  ORF g.188622 m.188622 type:complete len:449 (+) comp39391_c1_seq4:682-2028(+)
MPLTKSSILFLLLYLLSLGRLEEDQNNERNPLKDVDVVSDEVFEPSSEWKVIQPGQAIPAGLHVRMDLQTGVKEAKLLETENEEEQEYKIPRDQRRGIINTNRKVFTKKEVTEMLAKIRDESPAYEDGSVPPALPDLSETERRDGDISSSQSTSNVKSMLKAAGINMRSEVEIMMTHVETLANAESTKEARLHALNELEYYLHQIDNARDLNTIGGLVLVVRCLNDTDAEIRSAAAMALGAAAQSNSAVQADCLEYDVLRQLLKQLSQEEDIKVQRRFLFALSSLVRQYPPALDQFLALKGVQALTKFLHGDHGVVGFKALTLLTDLLVEQRTSGDDQSVSERANELELLRTLQAENWCVLVPNLLDMNSADRSEKVLQAMDALIQVCGDAFRKKVIVEQVKDLNEKWKLAADSKEDDGYYELLADTAKQFLDKVLTCESTGLCKTKN